MYNYNFINFNKDFHKLYKLIDFQKLKNFKFKPKSYTLLIRDLIDNNLYNLNYGYFYKQAKIFNLDKPLRFNEIKNELQFNNLVEEVYQSNQRKQLWHTPTELFKPHYSHSIVKYILQQYVKYFKQHGNLNIFEIGGGNGTLMLNVLNYLKEFEPSIYDKTTYNLIEISNTLASKQLKLNFNHHSNKIKVVNKSIFDWNEYVHDPCFFIALEVLDNFSHDAIRFNLETPSPIPYQMLVAVDENGDYHPHYTPVTDPLIQEYLNIREHLPGYKPSFWSHNKLYRSLVNYIPFAPNLSQVEYLPTKQLEFLKILKKYFPNHKLIASDFNYLPDTIEGINAPVVQTNVKGDMIPCDTLFVEPGYFDIFFPTNFNVLSQLYQHLIPTKSFNQFQVLSHKQFLLNYADHSQTRLKDGSNPMLDYYNNASFFLS